MPVVYVIAGPNGIGKTTSSYDLLPAGIPIINSDEIAKEIRNAGMMAFTKKKIDACVYVEVPDTLKVSDTFSTRSSTCLCFFIQLK